MSVRVLHVLSGAREVKSVGEEVGAVEVDMRGGRKTKYEAGSNLGDIYL
jgi:hypothetical protein